jgi:hypothetical protein
MRGPRAFLLFVALAFALSAPSVAVAATASTPIKQLTPAEVAKIRQRQQAAAQSGTASGPQVSPLGARQSTSPFAPGIPSPTQTQTTPTPIVANPTSSGSSTDSGLSGTNAIAIALGAIVILSGISFFIWRDARRRAPVRHRAAAATAGGDGRAGAKQRAKPRKLSPAEKRRRKRGRAR